jgi:hypothetical protein
MLFISMKARLGMQTNDTAAIRSFALAVVGLKRLEQASLCLLKQQQQLLQH